MCGIFFTFSKNKENIKKYSHSKKKLIAPLYSRGPDYLGEKLSENYAAAHTLLSITGYMEQPAETDRYIILFNGEIYNDFINYNKEYGDTEFLCNFVQQNKSSNWSSLDGEFAIVIFDKKLNELTLVTDSFNTKPLYYQVTKNTIVTSTFKSVVENFGLSQGTIRRVPANTCITFSLNTFTLVKQSLINKFDFCNQSNDNFNSWNKAFSDAIRKRSVNLKHGLFVPLSSGHDSGAIVVELLKQGINFKCFMCEVEEDKKVIDDRLNLLTSKGVEVEKIILNNKLSKEMEHDLLSNVELIEYNLNSPSNKYFPDKDFRKMGGNWAANYICKQARKTGHLIGLFGNGGDEIYTDFWYPPPHNSGYSSVKNDWRSQVGPWPNFYSGWNEIFLKSTDMIGSHNSIEARFPLLDKFVVQEFLNLKPELKESIYKAPLSNLLELNKFPAQPRKYGFRGSAHE